MYALNARDGSLRWRFRSGDKIRSTPVIEDGVLYFGSDDNQFYAINSLTGQQLWQFGTGGDVIASAGVYGDTVYIGSHDKRFYALSASSQDTSITIQSTATPTPQFVPLTQDEMREKLDFAFSTSKAVESVGTLQSATGTEIVRQSYASEVIELFENGYFLLVGKTPAQEGWIPRIMPLSEYNDFIDTDRGGSSYLKQAIGFCCERTNEGLELIIRGDQTVASAIATVAHEAGHARQSVQNPVQSKAKQWSDLDAIQEAEAIAFEVAVARQIGEYAGIQVNAFPDVHYIRAYIDRWRENMLASIDDRTEIHDRGRLFMWLAVLHDPELSDLKAELIGQGLLSANSMLALHDRFNSLTPSEVPDYVALISTSIFDDLNFILGTINKRIGQSIQYVDLVFNVPDMTVSP